MVVKPVSTEKLMKATARDAQHNLGRGQRKEDEEVGGRPGHGIRSAPALAP